MPQHLDRDRHDELAAAVAVACDVARERVDVGDELRHLRRGRGAAHTAPEGDRLARDFAVEGAQNEGRVRGGGGCVEDVEAWGVLVCWVGSWMGVVGVVEMVAR